MLFHPEVGMPVKASGLIAHLGAVISSSSGLKWRGRLNQNAVMLACRRNGAVRPKTVQTARIKKAQGGRIDHGSCFKPGQDGIV